MSNQPRTILFPPASKDEVCREVAACIRRGGLVIVPTDTVYGLAASADIPEAVASIYRVKARDSNKPIPLLAADVEVLAKNGIKMGEVELKLAAAFWPGPLTLILDAGAGRTEGCRVPGHELLLEILKCCGGFLRVTSANISSEPPALTANDAAKALGAGVDLVIDAGPSEGGVASSVVRVEDGRVKLLREGALGMEALKQATGQGG